VNPTRGRHCKFKFMGRRAELGSAASVQEFLDTLVETIQMRPLGPAHLYEVEVAVRQQGAEPEEDEGGVTGVVVLSTSHAAIHTWPEYQYAVVDVYSCRDYDPAQVAVIAHTVFQAEDIEIADFTPSLSYRKALPEPA